MPKFIAPPATSLPAAVPGSSLAPPKRGKTPRLARPEDKLVRQEIVLMRTLVGMRTKEIATELGMSVDTVKQDLREARRSNLISAARDQIAGLVPKAIATLEWHLDQGDKDVALVVLEGLGVIGKHMQVSLAPPTPDNGGTFYEFRERVLKAKSAGNETIIDADRGPAALLGAVIDTAGEAVGSQGAG